MAAAERGLNEPAADQVGASSRRDEWELSWVFFSGSRLDELLPTVDVIGCSGDSCVRHQVNGERGDVGWPYDAPDRQSRAQLLAALVEFAAEDRGRERGIHEAGRDHVDADGRDL